MLSTDRPEKTIHFTTKHAPTLKRFMDSKSFISAVVGPFGSGKSSACLFKPIKMAKAAGMTKIRGGIVRNTYTQLRDTTLKTVKDWLPPADFGTLLGGEKGPWNYYLNIGGMEIELMFRALDRPDHVDNLLSLELTYAWLNEFREIPMVIYDAMQGRVKAFPSAKDGGCAWGGIVMDSNPYDEGSPWERLLEGEDKPDNVELFRQPSGLSADAENRPYWRGGPDYYTNLAKGKDKNFVKVYIEGRNGYIADGEPVTPEYDEQIHRSSRNLDPIPTARGIRFWDAGHNPTCILAQIHPISGRLIVLDTLVGENMGMRQLVRGLVKPLLSARYAKVKSWLDTGDPAAVTRDQSNTETSPAKVIETELGTKYIPGVTDWETRRQAIKDVLTSMPLLLLSRHERVLHEALRGGWKYQKTTDGRTVKDAPVKNIHSHPADAISQGLPVALGKKGRSDDRPIVVRGGY